MVKSNYSLKEGVELVSDYALDDFEFTELSDWDKFLPEDCHANKVIFSVDISDDYDVGNQVYAHVYWHKWVKD